MANCCDVQAQAIQHDLSRKRIAGRFVKAYGSNFKSLQNCMMREYLESFHVLSNEDIDTLLKKSNYKILRKGDFFIKEGKICNEVAFVQSGFCRSFYNNSMGEETTYCFSFSNSFVIAYSSFINHTKTFENIEALTDVALLVIQRDEILKLEKTSTNWVRLSKMIAEQEFVKLEERILLLLKENAEFRYRDLLGRYPDYLQLIPLRYLASYLGITQRHLSRIRKALTF